MFVESVLTDGSGTTLGATVPNCSPGGPTPCLGVPGNPAALESNYTTFFNYYGNPDTTSPCVSSKFQSLTSVTNFGCCRPGTNNDKRGACPNGLDIDGATLASGKLPCSLVGMTKSWGVTQSWEHGGVVRENISIATDQDVTYGGATTKQNVIRLRITGDLVANDDPTLPSGVFNSKPPKPTLKCQEEYCWEGGGEVPAGQTANPCWQQTCAKVQVLTLGNIGKSKKEGGAGFQNHKNPKARVGACVATANQFGPGRYSVLARVPKTEWAEADGRGYVFAIWTFAYTELYNIDGFKGYGTGDAGYGNILGVYNNVGSVDVPQNLAPSVSPPPNRWGKIPPVLPHMVQGNGTDGFFGVINHEIDIEIPANSPALAGTWWDWQANLTWSTMNCNTWLSDINKYEGETPYYTQAMASPPPDTKSFVSEDGEFHLYEIDWHVDPENPAANSVTWYFDGKEVYSTTRFVPFYAGRFVIGPWPGWWGSGGSSPQFKVANVDIASIKIVPQASPTVALAIAQMYDQTMGDGKEISCGFEGFVECDGASAGAVPPCPAPPAPKPPVATLYYCNDDATCTPCQEGSCSTDATIYPNCADAKCGSAKPSTSYYCSGGGRKGICKSCRDWSCPSGATLSSTCDAAACDPSLPETVRFFCDTEDNAHACKPCPDAGCASSVTTYPTAAACGAACVGGTAGTSQPWYDTYKWYLVGGGVGLLVVVVIVAASVAAATASSRRATSTFTTDRTTFADVPANVPPSTPLQQPQPQPQPTHPD